MFGGSKDGAFNQEISDLVGQTRVSRSNWQTGAMAGRTFSEDIAIIRPEEIRLPERHALVIAENGKPIIARLSRCIDGRAGARLLAGQQHLPPSWPSDTARLRLRRPGPPRHWLRRDVAESPPSRSPTGDRESRKPGCWCSPAPGKAAALAYRELDRAATGSPEQIRALGCAVAAPTVGAGDLPYPQPQSVARLDAVVDWLITEYVWEATDTIPACWPQHPHLVHEIAADQRRRARMHSPVTPWRNGTATACPPSPNA